MKPSVLMLCPSRNRPGNIAALIDCWRELTSSATLLVVNDLDDPTLPEYEQLPWTNGIHQLSGTPMRVGPLLNAVAPRFAPAFDIIGFLGDDHRPRLPGWDEMLAGHLAEKSGVAYGDDLFQREKLPTACMVTSSLISALGYMTPPGMTHLYLDDFWKLLGEEAGHLVYDPGVVLEHLHPVAGKAVMDQGYAMNNDPALYSSDFLAYHRFLSERWPADVTRLRQALR